MEFISNSSFEDSFLEAVALLRMAIAANTTSIEARYHTIAAMAFAAFISKGVLPFVSF